MREMHGGQDNCTTHKRKQCGNDGTGMQARDKRQRRGLSSVPQKSAATEVRPMNTRNDKQGHGDALFPLRRHDGLD